MRSAPQPPDAAWAATWRRSVHLFRSFLVEQTDPDRFYGDLARDSAAQVGSWHPLAGALLLDVGGGPGYFCDAFEGAGATYVGLDADAGEMRLHGREPGRRTVQGSGTQLPFPDATFDVIWSNPPIRVGKKELHAILKIGRAHV